jgi:alkylation response protein AidB-like acyl-CoA dehydrogenase
VDLLLSPDEADLTASIEQFLEREMSTSHLRERLRHGERIGARGWTAAGSLGIFSLGLPAEAGGAGCAFVEEALVFRALGRHLAPVEYAGQVIATRMAHTTSNESLRAAFAEGRSPVAVALADTTEAAARIFGLPSATHVLEDRGDALVLLAAADLPAAEAVDCLDPSTDLALVETGAVTAALEVTGAEAEHLRVLGSLLTAAMLVGIAEATRDAGVAYAKERVQFGRLIGANQAVKHPCADMATRCEAAAALLFFAALAIRDGRADAAFQVAAAKRIATGAAYDNSRTNVQVHGGMGVTWEHDAHLFVTRTHVCDRLFGDVRHQQHVLLEEAAAVP